MCANLGVDMKNSLRVEMPNQDPNLRIHNFDEVALGLSPELALFEANRCLECKGAPCQKGCPVHVQIPEFIKAIKQNDLTHASQVIFADNNLPSICGRVCPQESQCEMFCVRKNKLGGSVSIGALERFVGDYALKNPVEMPAVPKIGKKVAVVGSGPASLSCSSDLVSNGVDVHIYEALHKAGGVLQYGIPEFRLPKDLVSHEIEKVFEKGVVFEKNVVVGKSIFIDELLAEYDAVFIGSGAGLPMFLNIKGENLSGVYSANEYLTRVNLMKAYKTDSMTPILKGKRVVVVGAGNVAMDAARTARRLDADVTLVYRRSRDEMPARHEEIVHAEEEGIEFRLLTNPVEIVGDGFVQSVILQKMELGEPDSSGRRSPRPIAGSEFSFECDEVIVSLGTSPNPIIKNSMPDLKVTSRGVIETNEDGLTSIDRLYAGGDAVTGAATVIKAMGAGKKSASAILKSFQKSEQ